MITYDTLNYYNENAELYCEQTKVGNIQENYDRFLKTIPAGSYILDFGCGSGRDSKYFIENGYKVRAIDGSSEICKITSKYINQEVECMKFEDLDDVEVYDGIWACSSILHVEKDNLPGILDKMLRSLKSGGVIYTSFKLGHGYEIKEGKYYNYITKEEMEDILKTLSIEAKLIDYFETKPSTKRISPNTIWGNFVIKKQV